LIIASQKHIWLLSCCCRCCFVAPLVFGAIVAIDIVVVVVAFAFGTVSVVIPVDNCFSKTSWAFKLLLLLLLLWFLALLLPLILLLLL
jgi:hypothetical protein